MQRASSHGSQQEYDNLIGSFQPQSGTQSVQLYISERLEDLEHGLETFMDQMTEDMALEVEREQQHLMLMQDQVAYLVLNVELILTKRISAEACHMLCS